LLAIVGGAEPEFFHDYAREIAEAAGPSGVYKLIPGANHFYNRHTPEIVELIYHWLARLDD
jgi:alpha/beta superfamily hydrolase